MIDSQSYVELHCHSHFSLLDGASSPEALAARAAALGMPALALTDHDAVYGMVAFMRAARHAGIQPICGAELTLTAPEGMPDAGEQHLTLLVENQTGWHNLCYLISRARHNAPKGEARLSPAELVGCTQGLIALSGCRQGVLAPTLDRGEWETALDIARHYRTLFGPEHFFIELQHHLLPGDQARLRQLAALARQTGLECVASNNVHYATPGARRLQDVLVCIRHLTSLEESSHLRQNGEYYLKSGAEMARLFAVYPGAIANTARLAERCNFDLSYGLQDLPRLPTPNGMSSSAYLRRLCSQGMVERYGETPPEQVSQQLAHELAVIEKAGLSNYFLIVWDLVRFANSEGIRCQGRGSAANSLVAYLLKISPVDPLAQALVFERFLSAERGVAPDIDVDFDAARREEVIQYVYQTYGPDHVGMACTIVTFRSRSALRDVARALDLPQATVAEVRRYMELGEGEPSPAIQMVLELCQQLQGTPRHLGIHAGGMVITGAPLMGRVPTEPATMEDRVVVQWDKDGLNDVGLIKIDILGLRMLSALSEAASLIQPPPDLDSLTFDDPAVYEMIGQADTVGVFQVESRAQAQMLPQFKPRCFNDLIIAISLIRPGPIQGNMVHPFLRRRLGIEPVSYAHPSLEPALKETLGVILFQEQVLKVARDLAGFTAGQGELLRRALGAKDAIGEIERLRGMFLAGAAVQGVPEETAITVFEQLKAFGSYSFAKSHAAAFAVIVYQSAWLKRYHLPAFFVALLNNQPMGFWNAAVLVSEAKRQGLTVLPVDVHHSQGNCTVEAGGIRLGLGMVKGMGERATDLILSQRARQPFAHLASFCQRTRLPRSLVERLIAAGAMDSWGTPRRHLLWELGTLDYEVRQLDLTYPVEDVELAQLTPVEAMHLEQSVQGLSAGPHVMTLYRRYLEERNIWGSRKLANSQDGQRVRVAGLLVVHQSPPTAKGFHFLTLEDEDGMMNIIVRPKVYDEHRVVIRTARLLLVLGDCQREGHVINVLARRLFALPALS